MSSSSRELTEHVNQASFQRVRAARLLPSLSYPLHLNLIVYICICLCKKDEARCGERSHSYFLQENGYQYTGLERP